MRILLSVTAMLAVMCSLGSCSRQQNPDGTITTLTADGRKVTVTAVNDYAVKVTNISPAELADGKMHVATQAVVAEQQKFNGTITRLDSTTCMSLPSGLAVTLNNNTGAVSFSSPDARLLFDNAVRQNNDSTVSVSLATDSFSVFYGAGERGHALALNGDTLTVYNRQNYGYTADEKRISQMNISMPLLLSNRGYALLFDDHAPATITLNNPLTYTSETDAPLTYYFVYGGPEADLAAATEQLTALTGRQELPPFWALGYITSKYGYRTEAETRGVVDSLKRFGYPLDCVVLDLYWYGTETDMGRLQWNDSLWPDHRQMLADLNGLGVKTVLISQPYINKKGAIDNYNMLAERGMLVTDSAGQVHDVTTWVGDAGMFDMSNPETRQWLAERYRQLTDEGVGGWWGDLGEPEVHPETIRHHNGMTARRYHNVYGNEWSKIIYDLYKQHYPDTRLMTLMRGGTTGLQRYSVFPWSTDVSRSWGGLRPQVRIMLNSSLSGLGYMSHDVGGFAVDPANPTDPELYVRWMQLGTFSPVLRTHSQQAAEPYHYPDVQPLLLDLVKTRYRWLPYNYTLAYENATKGLPLVRPVNFRSADSTLADIDSQYLWGDNVMIAPVIEKGATRRQITLPQGTWVDYNRPKVSYNGPCTIDYSAPLSVLPILVRAGAFIPQADYPMENTGGYDASRYTVLYYPRGTELTSAYTLFEDDRHSTRSIAENRFALLDFAGTADSKTITITMSIRGSYDGMPQQKNITFVLPGITPAQVAAIAIDGTAVAPAANTDGWLTFAASAGPQTPLKARIELK